jgi:uncharacterized membrane protein YfcA
MPVLNPLFVLSGFAVGFLVGMTGVGGGSLMTPLLILLFHVHPTTAVGTDLLYASITKTGGSLVHGINKTIDWRIVTRLATGSLPACLATLVGLHFLAIDPAAANALVTKILSVALLATALALVMRKRLLASYARRVGVLTEKQTVLYTTLTGIVLGTLVTISSVGAGALGVTALILLYPDRPIVKIAGSDIVHAVPLTLLAGLGHLASGGIDPTVLVSLLAGSLPGIMISSLFAPRLPDLALRLILAGTLTVTGLRLLLF